MQVVCGTMGLPTATVRMRGPDGIARTSTGMGTGPVDAAYKAIDSLVRVQVWISTATLYLLVQLLNNADSLVHTEWSDDLYWADLRCEACAIGEGLSCLVHNVLAPPEPLRKAG